MKLIYAEQAEQATKKTPTFGDVDLSQFFVDFNGYICQKTTVNNFNIIAKPCGIPLSTWMTSHPSRKISKIIPKVAKIEF